MTKPEWEFGIFELWSNVLTLPKCETQFKQASFTLQPTISHLGTVVNNLQTTILEKIHVHILKFLCVF
jgi:hypothetical protein